VAQQDQSWKQTLYFDYPVTGSAQQNMLVTSYAQSVRWHHYFTEP